MTSDPPPSPIPMSIREAFECVSRWYKAHRGMVQESQANTFAKDRAPKLIEVLNESLSNLEMRAVLNEIVSDYGLLEWGRSESDGLHRMEEYAWAGLGSSGEPTFTEAERLEIKKTGFGRRLLGIGYQEIFREENFDGHRRFDSEANFAVANEELSLQEAFQVVCGWFKAHVDQVSESNANKFAKERAPKLIRQLSTSLSVLEMRAVLRQVLDVHGILSWGRNGSQGHHRIDHYAKIGLQSSGGETLAQYEEEALRKTTWLSRILGLDEPYIEEHEKAHPRERLPLESTSPASEADAEARDGSKVFFFGVDDAERLTVNREVWKDTKIERVNDKRPPRNCSFYDSSIPKVSPLPFIAFASFINKMEISLQEVENSAQNWDFACIEVDLGNSEAPRIEVVFRLEYA